MKKITLGVLAHVDAGKTTLSETILYLTGATRKMGRVDKGDTFLDTDPVERNRGITVFSKEARFTYKDTEFTLVDTPGHADFSAEMERSLSVLDCAVLVVSGAEGVQSHTRTLLKLFGLYNIPFFIFVNKMDMPGASREDVLKDIRKYVPDTVDITEFSAEIGRDAGLRERILKDPGSVMLPDDLAEDAATCSEELMDSFMDGGLSVNDLRKAIGERRVFPVNFGSALKNDGVDSLLETLDVFTEEKEYPEEFGALVYKITRDSLGNRLTHMKITGGVLKNKMQLVTSEEDGIEITEKAEQIRLYNGDKFKTVNEACAGMLCAVLGLKNTYSGQVLGSHKSSDSKPFIEPALTYTLDLPDGDDPVPVLQKLRELEDEDPTLRVIWEERTREIKVSVMGELEKDLLKEKIPERFGVRVGFSQGKVIYKETIDETVEGIGHYEPLRHYAEVRLLMEPLPEGSGLVFETGVPEDELAGNWQRLIMKHLLERRHRGTAIGAEITDMRITLINGRAHLKHTEGGDFRQATYRAVRQGLRKALADGAVRILEPFYDFSVTVPLKYVGRVMTDMDRMSASCRLEDSGDPGLALIRGRGPVATLREYQMELNTFSEGMGRFDALPGGYGRCHNEEEVKGNSSYNCDTDVYNPCGSVFTDHGAGVYISWDLVDGIAHTEGGLRGLKEDLNSADADVSVRKPGQKSPEDEKSLKAIFEKTYGKSKRDEQLLKQARSRATRRENAEDYYPAPNPRSGKGKGRSYYVVDGYNVLFSCDELKELREANIDGAREALIDILENYQGFTGRGMTIVFDGYKVKGNPGTRHTYGDLEVIYTKEAETADRFIEEFAFEKAREYDITVVSSDRSVQMSSLGDGAGRLSARDFLSEVSGTSQEIAGKLKQYSISSNRPFEKIFSEADK